MFAGAPLVSQSPLFLLPDSARFRITRFTSGDNAPGPGLCNFTYSESLPNEQVTARTIETLRPMLAVFGKTIKIKQKGFRITISAKGLPYHVAASMIVGEFMQWTPMAEATLRDLMCLSAVQALAPRVIPYLGPAVSAAGVKHTRAIHKK